MRYVYQGRLQPVRSWKRAWQQAPPQEEHQEAAVPESLSQASQPTALEPLPSKAYPASYLMRQKTVQTPHQLLLGPSGCLRSNWPR